ncbi:unnamed protein product, partial [Rotaria magnacalcarata]
MMFSIKLTILLYIQITEPPLDTAVYVAGWGNTVYGMWNSSSLVLRQA